MIRKGNSSDEQRLVKRLRNGDNGAMRDFYALYADYLVGVCSRYVVDEDDIKDVFQDSLVSIFTHIADFQYRGADSLRAWATKIAVSQSLKFLKTARRHEMLQLERDIIDEPEADDPPIRDIPPDVIHQMVCQLPTGYRTVFNLYVFEGRSHKEIASLLGIKEKTSSSQLHRAKNLLVRMIQEYNNKKQQPQ